MEETVKLECSNTDWSNALDRVVASPRSSCRRLLKTGFPGLDKYPCGDLFKGSVTVIAGESFSGTSSLARKLARNMALGQTGDKVMRRIGIFSLDLTHDEYVFAMTCAEAGVSKWACNEGFISPANLKKLRDAAEVLKPAQIFIDDTCIIDGPKLVEKMEAMKMARGIDLFIIDKFPLIEGCVSNDEDPHYGKRNHKRQIANLIRRMARKLQVAVIILTDAVMGDSYDESQQQIRNLVTEAHKFIAFPYIETDRLADNIWLLERPALVQGHPDAGNRYLALVHSGLDYVTRLSFDSSCGSISDYEDKSVSGGNVPILTHP